jgi:hypothetical protein
MYAHSLVLNRFLQLIGGAVFLSLRQRDASEWGKFAPLPTRNENYPARALIGWQENLHGARMRLKKGNGASASGLLQNKICVLQVQWDTG